MQDDDELRARRNALGRGTSELAKGRFESVEAVYEQQEATQLKTELFRDTSRSVLSFNDSPDVGMAATLNPYRGCEHGCIYCYARPTHEYLGYSAGLDFETKLYVKEEAPALLRKALMAKSWQPQTISFSGITDCYQPIERKLHITRQCLEVLLEFRNPAVIITKNHLVTRDIDLLEQMAQLHTAHVIISLTTLDKDLARRMEPRASAPLQRLRAISALAEAGIPVTVNLAPVVPGLTDPEIPALLKAAAEAGAVNAGYTMLRLPYGVKDLFVTWLEEHYPLRAKKVLSHIRDVRGGKLNSADFGERMRGKGVYAAQIEQIFRRYRREYGLDKPYPHLTTEHFRRPTAQMSLFD